MHAERLIKRFRREAAKNPKKALVLGLLVLVALYFWAPLVVGWFRSEAGASGDPTQEMAILGSVGTSPASSAAASAETGAAAAEDSATAAARRAWRELAEWIDQDTRMVPVSAVGWPRDPFVLPAAEEQVAEEPSAAEVAAQQAVTPQSLGLTLSSTVVGARRRIARIAGKNYGEGDTVEATKDGRSYAFLVASVTPRRVVLSREGQRYELTIPLHLSSGRIEPAGQPAQDSQH